MNDDPRLKNDDAYGVNDRESWSQMRVSIIPISTIHTKFQEEKIRWLTTTTTTTTTMTTVIARGVLSMKPTKLVDPRSVAGSSTREGLGMGSSTYRGKLDQSFHRCMAIATIVNESEYLGGAARYAELVGPTW